jgi:pantetheine-phosphate adenylyltransferase
MRTVLIPGSYDPITLGHLEVIRRATALFDRVVVAVMDNDAKTYRFTREQRLELAKVSCAGLDGVEVLASGGMLYELAERLGACAILKGVRNETDFVYEQKQAAFNHAHCPAAETIYLPAYDDLVAVSSTRVRELLDAGEEPIGLLAPQALALLRSWKS